MAVNADPRLGEVRRWWRENVPGPSLGKRLDAAYTVVLMVAIFGAMVFNAAHTALAQVLSVAGAAVWGPGVVLVALVAVARWGAYQGPVVYAVADVAHLLGAPLSRRGLAVRRLARAMGLGAFAGAVVGAVLVVGLDGGSDGLGAARTAGVVGAVALVGVVGVAFAWAVQSSPAAERLTGLAAWPVLAAAVALGVLGRHDAGVVRVERWTGPWGWASAPLEEPSWALGLAALALFAALCAGAALARCGRCPTERHLRRAEARAGAAASLAAFDARSTRRALQGVAGTSAARRRDRRAARAAAARAAAPGDPADRSAGAADHPVGAADHPARRAAPADRPFAADGGAAGPGDSAKRPSARESARDVHHKVPDPFWGVVQRRPGYLLAWRGAAALRRTPGRAAEAVVLGGAAGALFVAAADRFTAAAAAGLLLYVAATRVLEPLRQEIDSPGRTTLLLKAAWGRVLLGHLVLPAYLVGAAAALAGATCAAAGAGAKPAGALVIAALVGVPSAVATAALSARRGGRLSTGVLGLANADTSGAGGFLVVGWVLLWPLLGAALAAVPAILVAHSGAGALPPAVLLGLGPAFVLRSVLLVSERP